MVFGIEMFVVDPLGPVCLGVGPWMRLVPTRPRDARSDLGNLKARSTPLALVKTFWGSFCGVSGRIVPRGGGHGNEGV